VISLASTATFMPTRSFLQLGEIQTDPLPFFHDPCRFFWWMVSDIIECLDSGYKMPYTASLALLGATDAQGYLGSWFVLWIGSHLRNLQLILRTVSCLHVLMV